MDEQTALSKGMGQKAVEIVKRVGLSYLKKYCEPDPNRRSNRRFCLPNIFSQATSYSGVRDASR